MAKITYLNAIDEAGRELAKLKKEHGDLLRRIEHLESFIKSGLTLAGQENGTAFGHTHQAPVQTGNSALLKAPLADQIAEILRVAGMPLHAKEILRRLSIIRDFTTKNPLGAVIVAIIRRKKQFKRTAPNTFALTETDSS